MSFGSLLFSLRVAVDGVVGVDAVVAVVDRYSDAAGVGVVRQLMLLSACVEVSV